MNKTFKISNVRVMKLKFCFITIIILLSIIQINAQQLPVYSQYMMNGFLLNPAIAGSDGYTSINLTAREQWLGLDNAPNTQAISFQTRMLRNSFISKSNSVRKKSKKPSRSGKVGIGGYVFNDKSGILSRTGFQLAYSFHITMNESQLSFGLSATGFQFKIDANNITLYEVNDPLILGAEKAVFIPDANFGVFITNPNFYGGFSVAQLLESAIKLGEGKAYSNFILNRHYYFIAGYKYYPNDNLEIQPSIFLQTSKSFKPKVDVNVKVYFLDDYWGGISYRTSGSFIIMAGLKVDKFYFGYAIDVIFNNIRKHSFGSHEVMLAVKFGDNARRYKWLNRY